MFLLLVSIVNAAVEYDGTTNPYGAKYVFNFNEASFGVAYDEVDGLGLSPAGTIDIGNGVYSNSANYTTDDYHFNNTVSWDTAEWANLTVCYWIYPTAWADNVIFDFFVDANNRIQHFSNGGTTHGLLTKIGGTFVGEYTTAPVRLNEWDHICFSMDNTNMTLWVNGTKISSVAATKGIDDMSSTPTLYVGDKANSYANGVNVNFDELLIFNRSLNDTEITAIYEGTTNPLTSNIDLLFTNTTDTNYNTTFDEDEPVLTFINWTYDNATPIGNEGSCNITLFNASNENITSVEGSMNKDNELEVSTRFEYDNYDSETVIFTACHETDIDGKLFVDVSCNGTTERKTYEKANFPLCADGNATIQATGYSVCYGSNEMNVTFDSDKDKFYYISDIRTARQFFEHTDSGDDVEFNASSGFWKIHEPYIYTTFGTYDVYANCSHNTTSDYDNNVGETLEIIGPLPTIFIELVNNTQGLTNLVDGVTVEYGFGVWNWYGACVNCEGGFNVSWVYPNGTSLYSVLNNNGTTALDTPANLFRDFDYDGFYNITVNASNTQGNITIDTLQFNVTDSIAPVCTGLDNTTSVTNNTDYHWNVNCVDESFFEFNIVCDNAYNFSITGLNTSSYDFINQTTITDNTTCTGNYSDGHTNEKLDKLWKATDYTDYAIFEVDDKQLKLDYSAEVDKLEFAMLEDRIEFTAVKKVKDNKPFTFTYHTVGESFYFSSDKYKGWIVDSSTHTWIDFNNFENCDIEVTKIDSYTWEIEVRPSGDLDKVKFKSIGELNTVTFTQTTDIESLPTTSLNRFTCDVSTTGNAILIVGVMFFILSICIASMLFKIPILELLIGFFTTWSAWYFVACFQFAHIFFIILGLTVMLKGIFDGLKTNTSFF